MIILVGIIMCIATYGLQIKQQGYHEDYIGLKSIQPIKGIFILLVFVSHFASYIPMTGPWNQTYSLFQSQLGQLVVAPFLFYSGYGVVLSIEKKGIDYVKAMPLQRIGKVLLQFAVAVVLYLILQLALGNRYNYKIILLSFVGWESLGNSNWYIFCILCLYCATWLSYFLLRKGKLLPLLSASFLSLVYVVFIRRIGKPQWWYNTALAYTAGMWFAYLRKPLEKIVFSHWAVYATVFAMTVCGFLFAWEHRHNVWMYEAHSILFSLVLVLLSCKLQLHNRFLTYCGEHLFSLFILQRIPMILLKETPISQFLNVYFMLSLVATFAISWCFDKGFQKLFRK